MVTLMFLFTMLALVKFLDPYNREYLNQLEFLSLFTSTVTVYFCIYFITDNLDPCREKYANSAANTLMFLVIVLMQMGFIAYWAYCFFKEFQSTIRAKHPRIYLMIFKCCRMKEFQVEKDLDEYQQKVLAPMNERIE